MAKDDVTTEVSGLQLSNSTFSASPPGSLLVAENIVMPQKGVAEPRRGQAIETSVPDAATPFQLAEFDGETLVNYSTTRTGTNYQLAFSPGMTPLSGDPYNPVDDDGSTDFWRMKFGFAGSYLHFCTTTGPKTLETTASTPREAGLLRMPDPSAIMVSPSFLGTNGVGLDYGSSRAYRTVLRRLTDNGTSLLSPPSGRVVVTNRLVAEPGDMVRVSNVVTVTLPQQSPASTEVGLLASDTFTIDPGEVNFPATTETVASVGVNSLVYNDVGADSSNTATQNLDCGPRPVLIAALLPPDATTSTPVRIYRSRDTTSVTPSDEMFLVAEIYPSPTDISNGFLGYYDVVPQSVTDDPLYTNPLTGEGALQANYPPPLYRDTSNWSGMQFYVNTTGPQQFRLQMLGVGGPDGVQDADTITIAGEAFTFKNSPTPGDFTEVQIISDSTPAANIQRTAQALVSSVIFHFVDAGIPISAYYESSQDGSPGKIILQTTSYTQGIFAVKASRPASWTPALDSTTDTNSQAERVLNGFSWSKPGQPEAVPVVNYSAAGSRNFPIRRTLGLQQANLLFKEGDGIYAVTGAPPFNVQQISVANIIAPDCACVMADSAWVYTDQGILRVSDSGGATVVSRQIETELNRLRALFPTETRLWSFAVPYEQERRVMFFVPFDVDSVTGKPQLQAWCYNVATQAWTGPLYEDVFSGLVNQSELKLKLGTWNSTWDGQLSTERNDQSWTDYADRSFVVTVTDVNVGGDPLVFRVLVATGVEAGDGIEQGDFTTRIRCARPDLGARYFEMYEEIPLIASSATIYTHYDVTVQFQPQGSPTARRTLTRLAWLAKPEWFEGETITSLVLTDQVQANDEIATPFVGFGSTPFGEGPFGNPTPMVIDVNPIASEWATAAQFFLGLKTSEVWMKLRLQGFSARLETNDGPAGRGK